MHQTARIAESAAEHRTGPTFEDKARRKIAASLARQIHPNAIERVAKLMAAKAKLESDLSAAIFDAAWEASHPEPVPAAIDARAGETAEQSAEY